MALLIFLLLMAGLFVVAPFGIQFLCTRATDYLLRSQASRWIPELARFPADEHRALLEKGQRDAPAWIGWAAVVFVPAVIFPFTGRGGGLHVLLGWSVAIPAASGFSFWLSRRSFQRWLRRELVTRHVPICIECGYDLRGQTEPRCPECGQAFDPKQFAASGFDDQNDSA